MLAEVGFARWPSDLARSLLEDELPRRYAHSLGVLRQATSLRHVVRDEAPLLEAAAVLHDIGYAPDLVETGFHPIDGARYLRRIGADERLVCLVAHHSCADVEAEDRELVAEMGEFECGTPLLTDAMIYSDMTSGPDGERVTPAERLNEILVRHHGNRIIERFVDRAGPDLLAAAGRVEVRLLARQTSE